MGQNKQNRWSLIICNFCFCHDGIYKTKKLKNAKKQIWYTPKHLVLLCNFIDLLNCDDDIVWSLGRQRKNDIPLWSFVGLCHLLLYNFIFICKNKTVAIIRALLCCVLTPCFIYLFGIIFHSFSPLSQELLGVSLLTTPLMSWMLVDVLIMCWKSRSNNHVE